MFPVVCAVLALLLPGCRGGVVLERLSTVYAPHDVDDNNRGVFAFDSGAVEQLAYEPQGKIIYGVGNGVLHAIDASDPSSLELLNTTLLPSLDMTDVEVCKAHVIVAYSNKTDKLDGGVRVYRAWSRDTGGMELVHDIKVGPLPDMVYPTPDCTVVVALENEAVQVDGRLEDPPGGVAIIRFQDALPSNQPSLTLLNFTQFDDKFESLAASGVRWVYRGTESAPNPFSNNVEPEYVTFSTDYTTAYIGLQENNAIAEVDLSSDSITAVRGLGFKQWKHYALDPSDKDHGINLAAWDIKGMYLPDSIHLFRWGGEDYIVTANEGDAQEYSVVGFSEDKRGEDFTESEIASSVDASLKAALGDKSQLGRLSLSTVDGRDGEGRLSELYAYGGRSFSVFRASDMSLVYDSGSDLEQRTAQLRPDLFNTDIEPANTVTDMMDKRSDNKGPETESVAVGEVDGKLLIFVGNERPGSVFVYSVEKGSMTPQFQAMYSGIPRDDERTVQQLYQDRDIYGVDPEFLALYGAGEMADYPVLLVAGSVSGTITTYKVVTNDENGVIG